MHWIVNQVGKVETPRHNRVKPEGLFFSKPTLVRTCKSLSPVYVHSTHSRERSLRTLKIPHPPLSGRSEGCFVPCYQPQCRRFINFLYYYYDHKTLMSSGTKTWRQHETVIKYQQMVVATHSSGRRYRRRRNKQTDEWTNEKLTLI